ncbi:MAG: hypothetical protein ABUK01_15230 [Leptospirales bacterium]
MNKKRKLSIIVLTGFMIIAGNLFARNGGLSVLKKDISNLHEDIVAVLKKLKKDEDGTLKIHLGGGLHTSLGGRQRYVFEETANIDFSGSAMTRIEFFYTHTSEKNMDDTVSVTYVNEKPSDEEFASLTLTYEATLEKDAIFKFSEVDEKYQYKILVGYRDKLDSLSRALGVYYENYIARENAGLGKVLEVGKEQENN